jgi:DMSO/TMAO reductase YedYZ heme-binding membrane subunit
MVSAVLLALTVVWGLLASTRLLRRPGLPAWLIDLHRGLGGLTVAFVVVHLVALVADSTVHFAWAELLVPFASAWRRGPVALGVAAIWGLAVVEGSSLLQRRMSRRTWRRLHLLSYPVALLVALHAATAGTDSSNPAFTFVSIALIAAIAALTTVRAVRSTTGSRRRAPVARVARPSGGP